MSAKEKAKDLVSERSKRKAETANFNKLMDDFMEGDKDEPNAVTLLVSEAVHGQFIKAFSPKRKLDYEQ